MCVKRGPYFCLLTLFAQSDQGRRNKKKSSSTKQQHHEAYSLHDLERSMKRALQKSWMRPLIGLPRDFRQMLLQDPAAANGANPYREDDVLVIQTQSCSDAEQQVGGYMTMPNENICLNDENALLPLKGIPVRPFYREISKRLYVLQQQQLGVPLATFFPF